MSGFLYDSEKIAYEMNRERFVFNGNVIEHYTGKEVSKTINVLHSKSAITPESFKWIGGKSYGLFTKKDVEIIKSKVKERRILQHQKRIKQAKRQIYRYTEDD